jgi:hypothetical protein
MLSTLSASEGTIEIGMVVAKTRRKATRIIANPPDFRQLYVVKFHRMFLWKVAEFLRCRLTRGCRERLSSPPSRRELLYQVVAEQLETYLARRTLSSLDPIKLSVAYLNSELEEGSPQKHKAAREIRL